jgi:cell wall-associated NlpC family hydrolase
MSVARRSRGRLRAATAGGALLAAAALSLPAAGHAAARPYDPPAASAAPTVPAAAPTLPTAPAVAALPAAPLSQLLTRLQTYYRQTTTATEAYNRAKETADQQRARAEEVDRQLADQRVAVAAAKDEIGLMARRMYQDGGVSPYLSMLTGRTPQDFFGQRHILRRAAGHQQDVLGELTGGEARMNALNTRAQRALDTAQHAQDVLVTRKRQVEAGLHQVEAALAGLTGAQISRLRTLEQQGADKAQAAFLDSKALGGDLAPRAPSRAGDLAIAYAFAQLGKPYAWGTQGPDSFDGPGLTARAWAHAGVAVPRTSQEQWARLPRVPTALLRPGDLVLSFDDAAQVALYIGDGLVIQAPRPGSTVQVSPIAAAPVLGAVRPDFGEQPLTDYRPRAVPARVPTPTPIAPPVPTAPSAREPGPPPRPPSA